MCLYYLSPSLQHINAFWCLGGFVFMYFCVLHHGFYRFILYWTMALCLSSYSCSHQHHILKSNVGSCPMLCPLSYHLKICSLLLFFIIIVSLKSFSGYQLPYVRLRNEQLQCVDKFINSLNVLKQIKIIIDTVWLS